MNIVTNTSRAYHSPCEIQLIFIAACFTAWVMMAVVVMMSVSVVVVVAAVVVVVVISVVVGVLTNIGVEVLVDVNVNVFAGVMIVFEFVRPGPSKKLRC